MCYFCFLSRRKFSFWLLDLCFARERVLFPLSFSVLSETHKDKLQRQSKSKVENMQVSIFAVFSSVLQPWHGVCTQIVGLKECPAQPFCTSTVQLGCRTMLPAVSVKFSRIRLMPTPCTSLLYWGHYTNQCLALCYTFLQSFLSFCVFGPCALCALIKHFHS